MKNVYIILSCILLFFSSCKMSDDEYWKKELRCWHGREIRFPSNLRFSVYGEDIVDDIISDGYKIVHYVDSTGCTSCKLNLVEWKDFITVLDSMTNCNVPLLFFIHTKQTREVKFALKESSFDYPVCLDKGNEFCRLNELSQLPVLHTFLLDKYNKVIAMGNPVNNERVKELYLNLISGKKVLPELGETQTDADISHLEVDLGTFDWKERRDTCVTLTNMGVRPLVIHDIITSCGCTVVDYDKFPAQTKEHLKIRIAFSATKPGHFNKTIVVHCNTPKSPYLIRLKGIAQKE